MTPGGIKGIDGRLLYPFIYEGTVTSVEDPAHGHRVKARIEGMLRDTGWARPKTGGGGGNRRGTFVTPSVGSTVLISFLNGELRSPLYEGGPWGDSEMPNDVTAAAGDRTEQIQGIEISGRTAVLRVTFDERAGKRSFRVFAFAKEPDGSETTIGGLEIDVEKRILGLYGLAGIVLRSKGLINLRSIAQTIGRRSVRQGTPAPL